jgi:hypothetical protein
MPNVSNWVQSKDKARDWISDIENDNRSIHFYNPVAEDALSTITISRYDKTTRAQVALSAQRVRVEMTRIEPDKDIGPSARTSNFNCVVFGYDGHPEYGTTDIEMEDTFVHEGIKFIVKVVYLNTPGGKQAWCRAEE